MIFIFHCYCMAFIFYFYFFAWDITYEIGGLEGKHHNLHHLKGSSTHKLVRIVQNWKDLHKTPCRWKANAPLLDQASQHTLLGKEIMHQKNPHMSCSLHKKKIIIKKSSNTVAWKMGTTRIFIEDQATTHSKKEEQTLVSFKEIFSLIGTGKEGSYRVFLGRIKKNLFLSI